MYSVTVIIIDSQYVGQTFSLSKLPNTPVIFYPRLGKN
jgi:hypothetical protein